MTAKKSLSIKGIAIIMMLIHHLFTWGQVEYLSFSGVVLPNNLTIEVFLGVFGKLCVTMYLFLSGYGFSSKYNLNSEKRITISKTFYTVWKIYRKYLLVLLVFLPYGYIRGIYSFDIKMVIANFTAFDTSYNRECWFLFTYILIVIFVLPLLVKAQNKVDNKWITLVSFGIIVSGYIMQFVIVHSPIAWFRDTRLFFNLYYFMLSQFAFVMGWMCKRWKIYEKIEHLKMLFWQWMILMIAVCFLKVYCPGGMLIDTFLTPIFIALCLKGLNRAKGLSTFFTIIGKKSTYMWLTHTFFAFYYWSDFIYGFKYPILIVAILILISYLTAAILEKIEAFINQLFCMMQQRYKGEELK